MIYEEPLHHDPEAVCHTFRAFNRWLAEDWGFAHADRIFAAPVPHAGRRRSGRSRSSSGRSSEGARLIVMRTGGAHHRRSAGARPFDADVRPVLGAGRTRPASPSWSTPATAACRRDGYAVDGFAATFSGGYTPVAQELRHRARRSTTSCCRWCSPNHFTQVPEPAGRVGRERRRVPARPVPQAAVGRTSKMPGWFGDDPVEVFRRHVWINPFWEDDLDVGGRADGRRPGAVRLGLAPHRGPARSRSTTCAETKALDADDRRMVLHDNVRNLSTPRPRRAD